MKGKLLLFLLALISLGACQSSEDSGGTGAAKIWTKSSTVNNYALSFGSGFLTMSVTDAQAGQNLLLKQTGLSGDFVVQAKFSDFSSALEGSYFQLAVSPSGTTSNQLACGIGLLPGTTFPVKLFTSGGGMTNLAEPASNICIVTIIRTSSTVTVSSTANGTGPAQIQLGNYTFSPLDVILQIGNNNLSVNHVGTVSAKLDNFGIIEGGGIVKGDDFTQDLIN
jgi:hypothetical protein